MMAFEVSLLEYTLQDQFFPEIAAVYNDDDDHNNEYNNSSNSHSRCH